MIEIILGLLAVVAIAAVIELIILTLEWLTEEFNKLSTGDVDEVGFIVKQAANDAKTPVIQGVFNKRTEQIVGKTVEIHTEKFDKPLEEALSVSPVVIFD